MENNEFEAKLAELEEKFAQKVTELEQQLGEKDAEIEKLSQNYANQKARAEKAEKSKSQIPDFNKIIDEKLSIMNIKKSFLDRGIPKELVDQFIVSTDSTIPEHLVKPWVQPDVPEPKTQENENAPEMKKNVLDLFSEEE